MGQDVAAAAKAEPIPVSRVDALLDEANRRFGSLKAVDFLGKTWTYREIADLAERATRGFQDLGLKKGDRVALCLPNTPYSVICYFAVLKAGGIVVNANPLYVEREFEHLLNDSGATILVTMDLKIMLPKLSALIGRTPLRTIVVCPMASILPFPKNILFPLVKRKDRAPMPADGRHVSYASLIARPGATPVAVDPENDIAVLQFTGGTTGVPKAAMLTHANLTANVEQIARCFPSVMDGSERMMGVLPFFHVFAMSCVMNYGIRIGAEIILVPRYEPKQFLDTIVRTRPTLYSAISDAVAKTPIDLSSLRYSISGGAPLPLEIQQRFERISGCRLTEGYGLTEASPVVATNPLEGERRSGSIGHALSGTTIEVRSPETGEIVADGERGEICVRGPQVMRGYWNRPDETANVFTQGALRTGDIGYRDAEGWYYIVDRIKDLIICSGFNVYPRVIEDALYQHPAVADAVVIGVEDAYRGQAPKAFVTLREGATARPDELLHHLSTYVSRIEMPREVEIRASLPRTMVGKLSKKELVAEEAAKVAAPTTT